ncbi:WD repeat-containing protein 36 [Diaphorina citri]|uniref:WD repeat-containing protein 36 n=1 Tax=Diaphorina citri TaxID=121845 RepID=A0A3Q0JD06_DIACI|nr:WD repeat-containing protein 36 [Diaphorina citri]
MVESTPSSSSTSSNSSKIFLRHRALGYVSNHLPVVARFIRRRKETLFVTCVGKAFHVYGCNHFKLLSVSPQHEDDITCLSSDFFHIYTSANNIIYAWRRGIDIVGTYKGHTSPVHLILPFGPHLISVDEESNVKVWDIKAEETYLELSFDNDTFKITAICHPSTYKNKILLGSSQGGMELWNLKSSKKIYSFEGWNSCVNVLEPSPVVDIIGVGLSNKKIILHNILTDESLMEFIQTWGPVTALSFRTDGPPMMVSGSNTGHLTVWNLEDRQVENQIKKAHRKVVTGAHFLYNEPLLVTSSPDNTLKLWIFDKADGNGRLLRIREGHSAPPNYIQFYGNSSDNILSAAGDSTLRIFNTKSETSNKNLGIASANRNNLKRKNRLEKMNEKFILPPVSQFSFGLAREKDWNNIAAIHTGKNKVSLWSFYKSKMDDMFLVPERCKQAKQSKPTCVYITHCGNFVLIGYSSGHVDRFNIQSGAHRGSYGHDNQPGHVGGVRGVVSDNLNQIVISGGNDQTVKVWHFKQTGKPPLRSIKLDNGISFFRTHQESSMLAVCLDDFTVNIIDIDTCTIIRKLSGHMGQLTDADFSPDSRWLITASMDCTIRVWDIPSSQLIDCFQVII